MLSGDKEGCRREMDCMRLSAHNLPCRMGGLVVWEDLLPRSPWEGPELLEGSHVKQVIYRDCSAPTA